LLRWPRTPQPQIQEPTASRCLAKWPSHRIAPPRFTGKSLLRMKGLAKNL
jgi:hypothetical protein